MAWPLERHRPGVVRSPEGPPVAAALPGQPLNDKAGGVLKSPVGKVIEHTELDPRDIPELPAELKAKVEKALEYVRKSRKAGDHNQIRAAFQYFEDVKLLCDRYRCNTRFVYFAKTMVPDLYISRHHRVMGAAFERIRDGLLKRLMVFMPPGCTKSVFCSILFPAWLLGQRPSGRIISASHTTALVEDFGRSIKDLVEGEDYKRIYPGVELRPDVKAAARWHTTQKGQFQGVGVGSAVAGRRADLCAIIDDPISEQDAYSESARRSCKTWYPGGFRTRTLPGTPIVLVMTRWHHDDLAGWLLEESKKTHGEKWEVIKFPAILDAEAAALLGDDAEIGGSLFPELWPLQEFQALQDLMPPHVWTALYMQEPSQDEGNIILSKWWKKWDRRNEMPDFTYIIAVWDTAYEITETSDFSACTVWGVFRDETRPASRGRFMRDPERQRGPYSLMLLKRYQKRAQFPELRKDVKRIHDDFDVDMTFVEPKASGKTVVQELRRVIQIREWNPERGIRGRESSKFSRAHAASVVPYQGCVYYRASKENLTPKWVQEVIDQCAKFPNAEHDDLVDTCSMAWTYLRRAWWADFAQEQEEEDEVQESRGMLGRHSGADYADEDESFYG